MLEQLEKGNAGNKQNEIRPRRSGELHSEPVANEGAMLPCNTDVAIQLVHCAQCFENNIRLRPSLPGVQAGTATPESGGAVPEGAQ